MTGGLLTMSAQEVERISVAEWETQLTQSLPKDLRGSLPTIEEIEAELSADLQNTDNPSRSDV